MLQVLDKPQADLIPSGQATLEQVIMAKGNLPLAAERLGYTVDDIRSGRALADITIALKPHMRDLKEYMQVAAALELFSFIPQLHRTLVENLTALEPSDAVNAYMKLMDQVNKITDDKQMTLNINDIAWRHIQAQLPSEVIEAYLQEQIA